MSTKEERAVDISVTIPVHHSSSTASQYALTPASFPAARTPSVVDFPGAFKTGRSQRRGSISKQQQHMLLQEQCDIDASLDRISVVANTMKSKVTEAVGGVVSGVYNIVNYVNPLSQSSEQDPDVAHYHHSSTPDKQYNSSNIAAYQKDSSTVHTDGSAVTQEKPPTSTTIINVASEPAVVADIDERLVADANADNPENNRPPTPTKPSFTSMLRFPSHAVTDPSMHSSNAEYKKAAKIDPVSRNVSQRTGQQFVPGAEERRRYMRRMSKAPQLTNADAEGRRRSLGQGHKELSGISEESVANNESNKSHMTPTRNSAPPQVADESSCDSDDSDSDENHADDSSQRSALVEEKQQHYNGSLPSRYMELAEAQRAESRTRSIEPWRFISPRVKRVKRRTLWRLFLAQEITPPVYDEAGSVLAQAAASSVTSSPMLSPQRPRQSLLISPTAHQNKTSDATTDYFEAGSLRRKMLEASVQRSGTESNAEFGRPQLRARASQISQLSGDHSIAPSSACSSAAQGAKARSQQHAIWAMEFSKCGRYLAAGGQDGVVRIWRIAAYARAQDRERQPSDDDAQGARNRVASGSYSKGDMSAYMLGHSRRVSTMHTEGVERLPFTNTAPIAKGKHGRNVSASQTARSTRTTSMYEGSARQQSSGDDGHSSPVQAGVMSSGNNSIDELPAGVHEPDAHLHPMHAYELLEPIPYRSYVGHSSDVLSLSWSKNGFLLSASMDRTVRLWHPHRPECLCTFKHRDIVTSVAFNPHDDRLFISGSLDSKLRLWDIPARGVRHWTKLPDGQMVTSVAFTSPKGDTIVAGTYRGMCVFYSTNGLTVQGRMHARSSRGRNARGSKITGFAHHPVGSLPASVAKRLGVSQTYPAHLLVSSNDSRLRMFDLTKREIDRKYKGHANASSQAFAHFSSDGRYIISGSEDHNIYVWSVAQDNAATVSTHPNSDHIRRVRNYSDKKNRLGKLDGLFGKKRDDESKRNALDNGEWESLDGQVEEKSIYEYFPAHDATVSQALFAPYATLQYLAQHGDPILSRKKLRKIGQNGEVENAVKSTSNGTFGRQTDLIEQSNIENDGSDDRIVEDMTCIIVSADAAGNIRVFRKDINVRSHFPLHVNPSATTSKHSLTLKHKGSISSLARAIGCDSVHSVNDLKPGQNKRHSLASVETHLAAEYARKHQAALNNTALITPPPVSVEKSNVAGPKVSRTASFWSKIGRRNIVGRKNSAGETQLPKPEGIVDGLTAKSVVIGRAAPEKKPETCEFCGHDQMIEFAVALPDSESARPKTEAKSGQAALLVCGNCKRVKNMPTV